MIKPLLNSLHMINNQLIQLVGKIGPHYIQDHKIYVFQQMHIILYIMLQFT
jgi:hypothetical protein